jgi:GH25 family lysozyme M1 (1,4-beta-N-acetylmuramidase)
MATSPTLRRLGFMIAATAGLTALAVSSAAAEPIRPPLTAAAQRAGLQAGNATMGWQNKAAGALPADGGIQTQAFKPTGILGLDVASYQRKLNWASWAKKGKDFAYIKATEGTSYRNPYWHSQYYGAGNAGLIRGSYHFARPAGASGKKQAAYFVIHGGGWKPDGTTLPGVLDIEYNPYGKTCYGLSKKKMVAWITDFTHEYKRRTTRDVVIYSTADWWTRCTGNTKKFTNTNPLWAARYGTKTVGKLPGSWRVATFWQYTSRPLDQDRFSGSMARLRVLAMGAEPLP